MTDDRPLHLFPQHHDPRHPVPVEELDFLVEDDERGVTLDGVGRNRVVGWMRIADDCAVPLIAAYEFESIVTPDDYDDDLVTEALNPSPRGSSYSDPEHAFTHGYGIRLDPQDRRSTGFISTKIEALPGTDEEAWIDTLLAEEPEE